MKAIFLGTNGWYDTKLGNTISTLIETKDYFIILDAGNGIYKAENYIPDENKKEIFMFLSHFHLDHIVGLHILNKFSKKFPNLKIYIPKGTKEILKNFVNIPFTLPISDLTYNVEIYEISDGIYNIPFKIECLSLIHYPFSIGYRIEIDDKVISYCMDTGICENAIKLARNSELLISECSFKSNQRNPNWPHLNPEDAATIAKEAQSKNLILTHFDAAIYKTMEERKEAEKIARKIFKNTFSAYDEMIVEI
ncbi:MAG: MBL fold metallo-hydrolase [Candidatus Altarchaeaceae archaeon]